MSMSIHTNSMDYKAACRDLRREESDLLNRLKSIALDFEWLQGILSYASDESSNTYPLLANLRCGAWYCPPSQLDDTCHFKSTDGHYGTWAFSLSRFNLNVVSLLEKHTAVCIIDSTRKGKVYPDALTRTIPIWAAVINRIKSLKEGPLQPTEVSNFSHSERSQVDAKIDRFVKEGLQSGVVWEEVVLTKPIEVRFISHQTNSPISVFCSANPDAHTIFCISVSSPSPDYRPSFSYIQGAGDDHQTWSRGLEPAGFWEHKDQLLQLDNLSCVDLAEQIASQHAVNRSAFTNDTATPTILVGDYTIKISSSTEGGVPGIEFLSQRPCEGPERENVLFDGNIESQNSDHLKCVVRSDSKKDFEKSAPFIISFANEWFKEHKELTISCETGSDVSVAASVLIIAALSSSGWELDFEPPSEVSKQRLRAILSRLTTYAPRSSPSRNLMKQLNRFFLSKDAPS
eukprot:TRINITY_DN4061_c0_g1_i1.p1 TRINITY_DN4061_c0_g1~~TRINITY_DN4061_c0_g1_i1.p1  ORF type:complete len:458 (+),score=70.81 TRINITY_DN4061_c0_g1_i1:45-1418(+)